MQPTFLKWKFAKFILLLMVVHPLAETVMPFDLPRAAERSRYAVPETVMQEDTQIDSKMKISDLAKSGSLKWLCYYGADRSALELPGYKLLILEADALGPVTKGEKGGKLCLAYMSIGEIARSRWFWPQVENKPWVLEKNPAWSGSAMVDPRSREWSDMLVNTIAPKLLAAGYDGLMLDNVDIGAYLEQKDPKLYAGAEEAVRAIIRRLREAYPHAVLIANGGLDTAAETAESLDAVMRESIFSSWVMNADGRISYENVSPQARAWLLPRLMRIRAERLPILDLEYVDPKDIKEQERVCHESEKAGYFPYIAQRSLMYLPHIQNMPSGK